MKTVLPKIVIKMVTLNPDTPLVAVIMKMAHPKTVINKPEILNLEINNPAIINLDTPVAVNMKMAPPKIVINKPEILNQAIINPDSLLVAVNTMMEHPKTVINNQVIINPDSPLAAVIMKTVRPKTVINNPTNPAVNLITVTKIINLAVVLESPLNQIVN
jgi:hypothetical protein